MPSSQPRILVLLNPGRTSRHYLLGLARAAEQRGVLAGTLELGELWGAVQRAGVNAQGIRTDAARQARALVARERITHVLSYVHNGVFDFGLHSLTSGGAPVSAFAAEGARHLLLWTDHPNWALGSSSLESPVRELLAHPAYAHVVKSGSAAAELRDVCRWPSVHALPPGEDPGLLIPARNVSPVHDAVLIMSDAAPPPAPTQGFLGESDPDPGEIMRAMRPSAERAWALHVERACAPAELRAPLASLASDWLDAKLRAPESAFWSIAESLDRDHGPALAWLKADPRRWYGGVAALNAVTAWRRFFWPAWLARRVNLGLYGAAPDALERGDPAAPRKPEHWVDYERQPEVYALGRAALNINAAHDEEGLTHKPFQITASGVPLVHHVTPGLRECFAPEEALGFSRGPELLEIVRSLGADGARRAAMADAARARLERDHTWSERLLSMLAFGDGAVSERPVQSAA